MNIFPILPLITAEYTREYERVDQPRGKFFHTDWTGHGGDTTANTYTV